MKRTRRQEFAWIGTGKNDDIHLIAITPRRPTHQTFVIGSLSFHRIPLDRLDALYKAAKRFLLPRKQAAKRIRRRVR